MTSSIQHKESLLLTALLQEAHPHDADKLLILLSENDQREMAIQRMGDVDRSSLRGYPRCMIHEWHYSWLIPILQNVPEEELAFLMSSLSEQQQEGLSRELKIAKPPPSNIPMQRIALQYLIQHLNDFPEIPNSWIDPTDLTELLEIPKRKLAQIADYLGLYDLAADLPKVLNKQALKLIYGMLSGGKLQFLKNCSRNRDRSPFKPLNLGRWDGNVKQLQKRLHERGLQRIGIALKSEQEDFKSGVLHRLDTGRAKIVQSMFDQDLDDQIANAIRGQVVDLMQTYTEAQQ